jgi:hypothetical protein
VILLPADKLEAEPWHILDSVAMGVITGLGLTVMVTVFDPVHPDAVPVTL